MPGAHGRAPSREDAAADGLRRVQPDALERMPCHSCTMNAGDRVAVHVAEAVGDHDDPRASGEPEAPQRALARVRDALRRSLPRLAVRIDEPDGGTRRRPRPSRVRARRQRCRPRSRRPSRPPNAGMSAVTSDRARTGGCSRASARSPRRTRRTPPATLSRGGVPYRRTSAGYWSWPSVASASRSCRL